MSGTAADPRLEDPATAAAELLARCQAALEPAAGVEAEAYAHSGSEVTVRCEKGDLQLASTGEGEVLGLRLLDQGRLGFASTNQLAPASLEGLCEDARALARVAPADPHNVLPEPASGASDRPATELWSADLAALGLESAVELATGVLETLVSEDPRVRVDQVEVRVARGVRACASSRGTACSEADCGVTVSAMGMAVDGDEVGSFDVGVLFTRSADRLDERARARAREWARAWLENLGPRKLDSYRGRVLLSPEAFLAILARPLLEAASALAVQRGRSALAGRLGQRIAHESLTLEDAPADTELFGAGAFDREGQPTRARPIVREGVLETWLYNAYSAHADGVASTGHAAGGASTTPRIGAAAPRVATGRGGDLSGLASELGSGLLVGRFSGTVDPASGDFSGVAKSARAVRGGRVSGAVGETLISGNVFEVLARPLVLGSEAVAVHGAARAPWVLADGISVTGG